MFYPENQNNPRKTKKLENTKKKLLAKPKLVLRVLVSWFLGFLEVFYGVLSNKTKSQKTIELFFVSTQKTKKMRQRKKTNKSLEKTKKQNFWQNQNLSSEFWLFFVFGSY